MYRTVLVLTAAVALAGCVAENPPPVAEYYPPRPPMSERPPHPVPHHTVVAAVPKPRPEAGERVEGANPIPDKVKPLGQGMLTALSVGNYMDDQEKDLRAKLRGSGVTVSRVGDNLVVNIRSDQLFDGKAPALSSQGDSIVHRVADSARKFDSTTLSVNGFTDLAGAPQRDVKMSQMRADMVDKALVENGVDPHRISAKGFGAGDTKTSNAKNERNRRVEIDITPRVKT